VKILNLFPLESSMKSEHYLGSGTVCQPAEIGMSVGEVTEGSMAS
jgi:hypothetical protein